MTDYLFEGIINFRDYGGCRTVDGGQVVAGRLLRGGHQGKATPADIERLKELGISMIVDLRRSFERAREPGPWTNAAGVRLIFDSAESSAADLPYVAFLREPGVTPEDVVRHVQNAYRTIPYDPRHIGLYSAYLQGLMAAPGASLINCTHGKDRTGIICALTLHVLGVGPEEIMRDYMCTNAGLRQSSIDAACKSFASTYGITPARAVMESIVNVREAFLQTAFDEMRERSGSVEGYLDLLGFTPSDRNELRARYTA